MPGRQPCAEQARPARIALAGDVMLGRGVDQLLKHPSHSGLREQVCRSALDYVALAERRAGCALPTLVEPEYPWGEALAVIRSEKPDAVIVNLETSLTTSDDFAPKGINYRMHPSNVATLIAAGRPCCGLANNHVLDFGVSGLLETLDVLDAASLPRAGAGRTLGEASTPAVLPIPGGRALVWACCLGSSGVPEDWAAGPSHPGVWRLPDLSETTLAEITARITAARTPGDAVIVSIHWGPNWGYHIPAAQRRFAQGLADRAGVAIVHGHSSHHPKALELRGGGLILYGCGDLINDYEGIGGFEDFAPDLSLLYLIDLDGARRLQRLRVAPFRISSMRLNQVNETERAWLSAMLQDPARGGGLSVRQNRLIELAWTGESQP